LIDTRAHGAAGSLPEQILPLVTPLLSLSLLTLKWCSTDADLPYVSGSAETCHLERARVSIAATVVDGGLGCGATALVSPDRALSFSHVYVIAL